MNDKPKWSADELADILERYVLRADEADAAAAMLREQASRLSSVMAVLDHPDTKAIEQIYNWGAPLREIRAALSGTKLGPFVDSCDLGPPITIQGTAITDEQLACEHDWPMAGMTADDDICTKCRLSHMVWWFADKPTSRAVEGHGQTDEKGRPMTYWGGLSKPAEEWGSSQEVAVEKNGPWPSCVTDYPEDFDPKS